MFKDKVAWIIGSSSGIGKETAIQLNRSGAIVILSAPNIDELNSVQSQLLHREQSLVLALDLEDQSNYDELVDTIVEKFGRIDYLFNNGGISQRAEAADTTMEVDRKIMEINYFGNIALAKAVLPQMRKQQSGHIMAMSSITGKFGFYLRSAYSASKHALQGFYESLLLEEAKNNIFVTIAYPGKINTEISMSALDGSGVAHGKMDHSQETGMPVDECVRKLLKAVIKKKKSILIGKKEIHAVTIKRYFPRLFWKIMRKQSPT